jgi:S1-C subfamily serine protease
MTTTVHARALRLHLALAVLSATWCGAAVEPRDSVVKVYVQSLQAPYGSPWESGRVEASSGSGFVIAGQRILTNAHVVAGATLVEVRRQGDADKVQARVLWISHTPDLALLRVDSPGFFEGVTPLELGELPTLQQEVTVLGFPRGGDTLSVTRGVVSRVEHNMGAHSWVEMLAAQIDAAVNPGNSGGPVLAAGRVVGVAYQGLGGAEGVSYMIPTPVVRQFLRDVEDGRIDGVPSCGIFDVDKLESQALRDLLGLPAGRSGLLVRALVPGAAAAQVLRPRDVIMSIEDKAIGNDTSVEFRPRERTSYRLHCDLKQVGESVKVEVWRDGQSFATSLGLDVPYGLRRDRVPYVKEQPPRYFVYGGLIFAPLTKNLLFDLGWTTGPAEMMALAFRSGDVHEPGRELVVLQRILADEVNRGYDDIGPGLVETIDGVRPRDLSHALELVEGGAAPYLSVELESGQIVALERAAVRRRQQEILNTYEVRADRSAELARKGQ